MTMKACLSDTKLGSHFSLFYPMRVISNVPCALTIFMHSFTYLCFFWSTHSDHVDELHVMSGVPARGFYSMQSAMPQLYY
jgi:hypothetical protein